jgi:hypothetical protein
VTISSKRISKAMKILDIATCGLPSLKMFKFFLSKSYVCSNDYNINIDMTNVLVKMYKYI